MGKYAVKAYDGQKAFTLWGDEGWTQLNQETTTPQQTVAYLYACIDARAKAMAAMPFCIYKGAEENETEVDNSDDYENNNGLMPDPYRVFFLLEAALVCYGRAYLFKQRNAVKTLGLQYLRPDSITPDIKLEGGKLTVTFKRRVQGGEKVFTTDDVAYFWLPDPSVEVGAPNAYPLKAAMAAAGAVYAIDTFSAKYFERGMVKATIFGVPASTPAEERDRIENWVNKSLAGIKNAWRNLVTSLEDFKPTVIGGGLDEVKNISALTDGLQASISFAMGIPESYLRSGSAAGLGGGGVAGADVLKFYDNTILPDAKIIQGVLNDQVYKPLGLRFEFEPERLPVYQRDLGPTINALSTLINALNSGLSGSKLEAAINIVGMDISEEDMAMLTAEEPKPEPVAPVPPVPAAVAPDQTDQPEPQDAPVSEDTQKALTELGQWRRFEAKRKGEAWRQFECKYIPADIAAQIASGAKTFDEAEAILRGTKADAPADFVTTLRALAEALKAAA